MRAFRMVVPAWVVGLLGACGGQPDVHGHAVGEGALEQGIINGEACDSATHPSAVAILADLTVNLFGQDRELRAVLCTGTLIAPDVVMAAAHCLDPSGVTLGLGTVTREAYFVSWEADLAALSEGRSMEIPADALAARAWVKHPEFSLSGTAPQGLGSFHDISLIFLAAAATATPAVVITSDEASQLASGQSVEIAGWGQQTVTQQFQQPPAGTVGIKRCGTTVLNELGTHEFQVGSDINSTRKCHGDSGGPTYVEVTTDSPVTTRVIGVTSRAYDQSDCEKGGVDTRVDAYLPWLDEQMRAACSRNERVACDTPGLLPPPVPEAGPDAGVGGNGSGGDAPGTLPGGIPAPPGCASGTVNTPWAVGFAVLLWALRRRRPTRTRRA